VGNLVRPSRAWATRLIGLDSSPRPSPRSRRRGRKLVGTVDPGRRSFHFSCPGLLSAGLSALSVCASLPSNFASFLQERKSEPPYVGCYDSGVPRAECDTSPRPSAQSRRRERRGSARVRTGRAAGRLIMLPVCRARFVSWSPISSEQGSFACRAERAATGNLSMRSFGGSFSFPDTMAMTHGITRRNNSATR